MGKALDQLITVTWQITYRSEQVRFLSFKGNLIFAYWDRRNPGIAVPSSEGQTISRYAGCLIWGGELQVFLYISTTNKRCLVWCIYSGENNAVSLPFYTADCLAALLIKGQSVRNMYLFIMFSFSRNWGVIMESDNLKISIIFILRITYLVSEVSRK